MDRRLKHAAAGIVLCAAALLTTLLVSQSEPAVAGAGIVVPQAQESGATVPKRPPSSVSIPLPSPPVDTPAPPTSDHRQALVTATQPATSTSTAPRTKAVDFQAEDARLRRARIASNHSGFTGSGFADYDNVSGGSIEWTVTATTTRPTDVIFRFANGSGAERSAAITMNGVLVGRTTFPATNGWSDWQTVTVNVNLLAGTNWIGVTALSGDGGPNIDKLTLLQPA